MGCSECVSPGKHIDIVYGESWSGSYIDLNPKAPIFPYQSEDPCIFISPELGTFHVFAHTDQTGEKVKPFDWHHVSAHAFAYGPRGFWYLFEDPPYTTTIEWAFGETTTVDRRERPQITFFDGRPSLLVNTVKPGRGGIPGGRNALRSNWSYTHLQAIKA